MSETAVGSSRLAQQSAGVLTLPGKQPEMPQQSQSNGGGFGHHRTSQRIAQSWCCSSKQAGPKIVAPQNIVGRVHDAVSAAVGKIAGNANRIAEGLPPPVVIGVVNVTVEVVITNQAVADDKVVVIRG